MQLMVVFGNNLGDFRRQVVVNHGHFMKEFDALTSTHKEQRCLFLTDRTHWSAQSSSSCPAKILLGHLDFELYDLIGRAADLEHYRFLVDRLEVGEWRIQIFFLVRKGRKPSQVHPPVHEILRAQPE